ncbi:granzyme-like protein 1 [Melopsittacus undulatus]|uniref:granzyme-like protein 1 n=1 Tax=Melopsittacus undulatus TaxID=13146 RepID=UPI00146A48AA|nr:granzyme-like protein 1 [Melopsittacus undulatus]
MKVLQHLLLPILLLMSPAPRASSAWNWNDRGHTPRSQPVPYMAYVQGRNQQSCGGFLVAPSWVMTAAQCLDYKPLTVILGAHTVQTRWGSQQRFEVQQYHRHPDFTNRRRGNDILLLKLKGNATINQHVRTISFNVDQVPPGTTCIVKGWSHTSPRATLCEVWVTILKPRQCLNWNPWLAQNLICARNESFTWPKEGDAGDPLVCNNKAYGIFSYRHKNWPGFYTHIAPFLTWINSVMKSA